MGAAQSSDKTAEALSTSAAGPSGQESACPVPESVRKKAVYNVYNERIDEGPDFQSKKTAWDYLSWSGGTNSANQMPLEPNQQPCPGQRKLISTDRLVSTIPKGGTESNWVYPSPQMFYNALKRKGKGDDVTEEDMPAVVRAHNSLNEMTWQHILQWEALHARDCGNPQLLRFLGKPDQLSPLARLQGWLGGSLPFDRHDWYVERCGREVRYVIDFYYNDDRAGTPEAFQLRVRPGLDSFEAALDRTKMDIYTIFARYGLPCPVTGHPSTIGIRDSN